MGVIVPLGTVTSPASGSLVKSHDTVVATVVSDYERSYGTKVPSTGPRITIAGTKWSPAHPYVRTAAKYSCLSSGYIGRTNARHFHNGKYLPCREEILGPPGRMDAARGFGTSPFQNMNGTVTGLTANQRARLETELLLKAGQRKWSLGESLAESRQTLSLLTRSTSKVVRALLALRKGRLGEVPRILGVKPKQLRNGGSLSNYWLEYQYGWMPILNDIHDAHGVFTKGLSRPQMIRAVRRLTSTYDMSGRSVTTGNVYNRGLVTGKCTQTAQAIAYYRLTSEYATYFQQLGLINPAEVAWAVVPFSFVLDWFIPIQNTLEASTATVGMTFVDGSVTVKAVTSCKITIPYSPLIPYGDGVSGWVNEPTVPQYAGELFGMQRTVLKAPTAKFYAKSPFSSNHVVSALALLRQLKR